MKLVKVFFLYRIMYLIVCVYWFSPLKIVAQTTIKGSVKIDNVQEGVYASIQLLHTDSTFVQGTITDSIGNYYLSDIYAGDYLLLISSMGCVPQWYTFVMGNQDKELPLFTLKENNVLLNEVIVKASSFVRQKDRVLIIPNEQQRKHASTGYDLLYNLMIPGVSVDIRKGRINTFLGEATLYINGQKADYREIRALRPADIEKIEYIDMPTGKYAGDRISINYILKEKNTGGYVTLDGTQTVGYLGGDYNASLKINHKNTSYILFTGHSMECNDGVRTDKEETFYFTEQEINRTNRMDDAKLKKNNQYVQLNINNNSEKRILAGNISFVRQDIPENYNSSTLSYVDASFDTIHSYSETTQSSLMPILNLYGNFQLGQMQYLDVDLRATYTNNDYKRRYNENNYYSYTKVDEDWYSINFSTNYNYELKHNNSFGLNFIHSHFISSSNYQGDFNNWSHLWTAETLLMGQYNQSFGKVYMSLQIGGDLLQYRLHGHDLKRYLSPHANILLNFQIKDGHSLMYGLHTGNSNLPMELLGNVNQNVDSLSIRRGNPYLDKTNYYNSYLVYRFHKEKINLQVTGYYWGAINNIFSNYYIENNKLINSFHTDGNFHQLKGAIAVTYKVKPDFHVMLSGFYRYNKITGKMEASRSEWGGSVDANYYWKNFTFNIHCKSTEKTLGNYPAFKNTPATYGAFIRWKRNNWTGEVGTDNTFSRHNRNVMYLNTDVYCFHNRSYSETFQQTGYVKLVYTFDFGKKTSHENNSVDKTINSAILKVE